MQYTQSPIGLMTVQLDHLNFAACIIDFVSLHLQVTDSLRRDSL